MSVFKFYKFATTDLMGYFLNGGITASGKPVRGYQNIVGKTLIFTSPASHTVTFTKGTSTDDPASLTFAEVATQIHAVMTGVVALATEDGLVLMESTPSAGVAVTKLGTANPVLGLDSSAATTGKIFTYPDGVTGASAPHWVQAYFSNGYHVVVVRE